MPPTIPNRKQAHIYLSEAVALNPGPWAQHSRYVAQSAESIAQHHPKMEPEYAYVLGLLHDIGRRYGVAGMRHVIDGYHFLANEGYEDAARICLTHSYPTENQAHGASPWDGSQEELQFVRAYLKKIQYNNYDRLIQLCDAISLPNGFCLMEKRLIDVVMRYGVNPSTVNRWRSFFAIKQQIEQDIDVSIYRLLPGIIENTFEWNSIAGPGEI